MRLEYDEAKSQRNAEERGLPFSMVAEFDFSTALVKQDVRFDYPEKRYRAWGYIDQRIYSLVFCERGDAIRVISFRKANKREVANYENARCGR